MNESAIPKLQLPEASWPTLQKIVRAYYAKRNNEQVTVQEVAETAGLHRPQISANNNFLRAFGVVDQDSNKLTPIGSELALGLANGDEHTIKEATRKLVLSCEPLKRLVEVVEARGQLERPSFSTQLQLVLNIDPNDRRLQWSGTILDILGAAGLIAVEENLVKLGKGRVSKALTPFEKPQEQRSGEGGNTSPPSEMKRIPVPVSPGKLWYIEVNENPEAQEIKKFLEIQKLIFDVKE